MTDLESLIARVEAAEAGGRELDAEIGFAIDGWKTNLCPTVDELKYLVENNGLRIPPYTSDLNAALKLVEAKLPGWDWQVSSFGKRGSAKVYHLAGENFANDGDDEDFAVTSDGATPALAICAALLRALADRGER